MMQMRMEQLMECHCCKQYMRAKLKSLTEIDACLFGVGKYAVCPVCGQEVAKSEQTRSYKWQWSRIHNLREKMRVIEQEEREKQESRQFNEQLIEDMRESINRITESCREEGEEDVS